MDEKEQILEIQSPLQRIIAVAAVVCFGSLICFYWLTRRVVERLEVRWAEMLIYAIIPLALTFITLYRSSWHREIGGVARTCSVLLLSCVILGGELIAIGLILGLALFGVNGITGGNH